MIDIHYGRKRSGIKRELTKKIEEWLESIDDEAVRTAAKRDVIVTGGAIASMLLGEHINDFDIYFRAKATTKMVAEYYVAKMNAFAAETITGRHAWRNAEVKEESIANCRGEIEERVVIHIQSDGVLAEAGHLAKDGDADSAADFVEEELNERAEEGKAKYRPVFMSQNAITLSNKVQIVIRFYGEPDQIHNNYDFVHATCYWDHAAENLVLPAEALECLLSRTLIYRGSLYPIASIFRMKKFLERGWRITAGQQLKIMWQISELRLADPAVMREQLTGVDMAYMHALIDALSKVEDPEKINATYVGAIIDRIFD